MTDKEYTLMVELMTSLTPKMFVQGADIHADNEYALSYAGL